MKDKELKGESTEISQINFTDHVVVEQNLIPKIETTGSSSQTQHISIQHQETNTIQPIVKGQIIQSAVEQTSRQTNTDPLDLIHKNIQSAALVLANQFTQSTKITKESRTTQYESEIPVITSKRPSAQTSPKITAQPISLNKTPIREKIDFGIQTTPGLKTWIFENEQSVLVPKHIKRPEVKAGVTEKIQLLEKYSENDPPKMPSLELGALKIKKITNEAAAADPVLNELDTQEIVGDPKDVEVYFTEKAGVHGLVGFWESQNESNTTSYETAIIDDLEAVDKSQNGEIVDLDGFQVYFKEEDEIDIVSDEIQAHSVNESEDIVSDKIQAQTGSEEGAILSDELQQRDGYEGNRDIDWNDDNEVENDSEDVIMEDREYEKEKLSHSEITSDEEHEGSGLVDYRVENEDFDQLHFVEDENSDDIEHEISFVQESVTYIEEIQTLRRTETGVL
ncbi:hypothetical protein HK096_009187, partial [Nowakowskiella sp. JEL0078]